MNVAIISGNLGSDPQTRTTGSGKSVTSFRIANQERKDDEPLWIGVTAWERLGEQCQRYLSKGRRALVQGRLQVRSYSDKNGEERTAVEIVASHVEFLDRAEDRRRDEPPADFDRPPGSGASGIIQDPPGTRGGPYSSWTREQTQRNLGQPRESEPLPQDSDLPF